MKKVDSVISPINRIDTNSNGSKNKRFTKDKKYKILESSILHDGSFEILDDSGGKCLCLFKNCSHLNNKNWIII